MVNSQYLPTDFDGMLSHIMEECSEVIKAGCKLQRWGPESTNPDKEEDTTTNVEMLYREILDVKFTAGRLILKIEEIYGN